MVALVTPMDIGGAIDEASLRTLVEWQIGQGTQALVIAGTTGESALLSVAEKRLLTQVVLDQSAGRVPVIVGTGAIATADSIALTQMAMKNGADACLIMTPPYVKPTQEGLYQHYHSIATEAAIPIILYNVPKRTGCDISAATVTRLASIPNIVGIKEASTIERVLELIASCGDRLDIYSGEDSQSTQAMLAGAKGVISVTSNVAPQYMRSMCDAAIAGDSCLANSLQEALMPLHKALFVESNPIPVKWALTQKGRIQAGIRMPLTPLSASHWQSIQDAMHGID